MRCWLRKREMMRRSVQKQFGWFAFVLAVGLGLLSACRIGSASAPIAFEAEWSGASSQSTDPAEWIITEPDRWTEIWQETHPEMPPPPAPSIDFSRSMVVGIALGERRTGGFEVRIIEIMETDTELVAQVEAMSPPPDAITIMILTQPFHLVQIPRSSLPVRFEWNEPPPDAFDTIPSQSEGVY
jgi:hypothetical protein